MYDAGRRQFVSFDFYEFEHVYGLPELKDHTKYAYRTIEQCENLITACRQYLQDITEHANNVINADYKKVITLRREKRYYENKVYYYVYVENVPLGVEGRVTFNKIESYSFKGTERHLAKLKAKELIAKYPNAEFINKGDVK